MSRPPAVRCNTHVWNPAGRRRALLLHGLGDDGTCWWRLASELAGDGFLVVAPDLRSHGGSPTAVDHSLAALSEDVALLGDAWDVVVGHALGGAIAAELLGRPGFAHVALLLDPVLRLSPSAHAALRASQRAAVGTIDPAAVAAAEPGWDERDVHRKVLAAARVTPDVVDAVLDHNDPWDLAARCAGWPDVRVHLLLAGRAGTSLCDRALADGLSARAAVTVADVADAGHSVHRDRPDAVSGALEGLLGGSPPGDVDRRTSIDPDRSTS